MSFMKGIASKALGFVPGVGPLLSAGLDALGGMAGQKSSSNQTINQDSTKTYNTADTLDQTTQATEDPLFGAFRNSLMPMFQQEVSRANRPVYGDAQKASYLSNLNDLAHSSIQSLKGSLAGSGRLNSGAFEQGAGEIEQKRFGQAADFFGQLPMLEEQTRSQKMAGLLGMGMNWAGRAPLGQVISGQTTKTGTEETKGTSTSTGTATQNGPGFWGGLASNLGGLTAPGSSYDRMFKR